MADPKRAAGAATESTASAARRIADYLRARSTQVPPLGMGEMLTIALAAYAPEYTVVRLREDNAGLLAAAAAREAELERELYEARTRLGAAMNEVTSLAAQVDAALLAPLRSVLGREVPGG